MTTSSLNTERGSDAGNTEEKASQDLVKHVHDDPSSLEKVKSHLLSFN